MLGKTADISHHQRSKRVVILITSPLDMPVWPVKKVDGSWRMHSHKFNPVLMPAEVALPDTILSLDQINTALASSMQLFGKCFYLYINLQQKQFTFN